MLLWAVSNYAGFVRSSSIMLKWKRSAEICKSCLVRNCTLHALRILLKVIFVGLVLDIFHFSIFESINEGELLVSFSDWFALIWKRHILTKILCSYLLAFVFFISESWQVFFFLSRRNVRIVPLTLFASVQRCAAHRTKYFAPASQRGGRRPDCVCAVSVVPPWLETLCE